VIDLLRRVPALSFVKGVAISRRLEASVMGGRSTKAVNIYPHFLDDVARARIAMQTARPQRLESFESVRAGLSASTIALRNLIRLSIAGTVMAAVSAPFTRGRASRGAAVRGSAAPRHANQPG
jgi:hypothetical protein